MNHIKKYLHLAGMMAAFLMMAGCGEKQAENVDVLINATTEENVTETTAKEYVTEEITTEETTEETTKEPVVIDIPHEEEIRTLIEMYNESQRFLLCDAEEKKLITTVGSKHQWTAYILSYDEFSTLEELDAYWRQYFTEAYYEYYIRAERFFEEDGKLCMHALIGDPKKIFFETVSDFKETEQGFETFFDRSSHNCFEPGYVEKVKVNFVWENDVLKISEIERLE